MSEKAPKHFQVQELDQLPMPVFKKCLQRDFFHLQRVYLKEEARLGKGILLMTIDDENSVFNVTYTPAAQIPDRGDGLREVIEKATDADKFMRILAIEGNKAVTLKIAKKEEPVEKDVIGKTTYVPPTKQTTKSAASSASD